MPSWSPSEPQDDQLEPPTAPDAPADADAIAAARRLLAELFEDEPAVDEQRAR